MPSLLTRSTAFCVILLVHFLMPNRLLAQSPMLRVQPLALPATLSEGSHEISGLCTTKNYLLLLGENRADAKQALTAGVFALPLAPLAQAVKHQDSIAQFYSYAFQHLDVLQQKLAGFEGLEAIQAIGNTLFFTVETNMGNSFCYLIKGVLINHTIAMDTVHYCALPKPRKPDGGLVYNAGFESLMAQGKTLLALFEYNNHPNSNFGYTVDTSLMAPPLPLPLAQPIPFRITDLSKTGKKSFIGINYFYPGNDEKDFRCAPGSSDYASIYYDSSFHFYARLLQFRVCRQQIVLVKKLFLPTSWHGTNWEGIAPFLNGWLLINDKFTRYTQKKTELVYVTKLR